MTSILLGQLGSNGDCLYATTLARQIKEDFPGCHLTWAVSSLTRRVLDNNPYVDQIWEVPLSGWNLMERAWLLLEDEALRAHSAGIFDHVFMTQISPNRFAAYDGTIRPSIFRNYPRPITVPVETVIRLTEEERAGVDRWYAGSPAAEAAAIILMECSSKSGQSFMTPDIAVQVAERVLQERRKAVVLISTHETVSTDNPRIIPVGHFSIRETAQLTHRTDLFVGCGSGLTVVATSEAAKADLPLIQILKRSTSVFASFRHDFQYFGKPVNRFLEMTTEDVDVLARTVVAALSDGFDAAKAEHDDPVPIDFTYYMWLTDMMLLRRGRYADAAQSLLVTSQRYGWHDQLRNFGLRQVLPFLQHDPRGRWPHRTAVLDTLRAELG
jgi:hypothetical protein